MSIQEAQSLSLSGRSVQNQQNSELELGEIFGLLSNDRRRCAVAHMHELGEPVEFNELVDTVARCEYGEDYDTGQRHTVYTSLYQTHLPKLKKMGVVEYERVSGTISFGPNAELVGRHLMMHLEDLDQEAEHSGSFVQSVVSLFQ